MLCTAEVGRRQLNDLAVWLEDKEMSLLLPAADGSVGTSDRHRPAAELPEAEKDHPYRDNPTFKGAGRPTAHPSKGYPVEV